MVTMRRAALLALAGLALALPLPASGEPAAGELEALVAAMASVGFASSPEFSPDGGRIAFVTNLSGTPQVWTVPSTGGYPRQVTALPDPVQGVEWSPDGSRLAFTVAPGGGMNVQVYLAAPDGTGLERVTPGGRESNRLSGFSRDGRFLLLGSNRDQPGSIEGYLYDLTAGGPMRLVTRNQGVGTIADASPDGRWLAVQRVASRGDSNLFLVDASTGAETLLTPHQGPGRFVSGAFAPDGRTLYLISNLDRDRTAFARIALGPDGETGSIETLAARDDAELDDFAVSEDGRTAALLWNESGQSSLQLVDLGAETAFGVGGSGGGAVARLLASGRGAAPPAGVVTELSAVTVPGLPAEIVGNLAFSRDGRRLALAASGAATPRDLWVLDLATLGFTRVTESPHPGLDLGTMVRPELVRFPAHDGLELSAWLYRAPGAGRPGPMVLSFHGGPEGQERPSWNATYQALLRRGIGVLAPNVRGSSGFGKRFVNLDNGALRRDAVRDIEACARAAVELGGADRSRLGIMGGSYGGYMVMAGLTRYPELFAAAVDLFGVVNFETFFASTEPWMAAISTVEYGDPATERELLRELSPIHDIDRVKAPTLVLHGANDTNVPVVEAEQVVESLRRRGVPVEYVLFPDEGHGFVRLPNRIRSTLEIVRWFERYLGGRDPGGESG